MGVSKLDLELAARLLDDAAMYLDTLYKRHSITPFQRGMDTDKLRKAALALVQPKP